ncbi:MAG: hypothetical protein JNJ46_34955 [Myxococcales bacterium]|nr:hypothetical protein [Myxococcales bacterium]
MRYIWKIQTGNEWFAGTDSNIYLTLNGEDAIMKEVLIDDPSSDNDWEKNALNVGAVETEDLGEIVSGLLRSDHSGAPPTNWKVEWIKIQNEEDGREWTAGIGKWSDWPDTTKGFRLKFTKTDNGQYEKLQAKKAEAARKKQLADAEAADKAKREAAEAEKNRRAADKKAKEEEERAKFEEELAEGDSELDRELERARREAERAKKKAELDKLRGNSGGSVPGGGGGSPAPGGAFRTYELFGILGGRTVPLAQVVTVDRVTGRANIVPGGSVLVGDMPGDGFGLAGSPGRWSAYYGGRSPAEFGLDPDKGVLGSDGSRGWVLAASFLSQLFGAGWRATVY